MWGDGQIKCKSASEDGFCPQTDQTISPDENVWGLTDGKYFIALDKNIVFNHRDWMKQDSISIWIYCHQDDQRSRLKCRLSSC